MSKLFLLALFVRACGIATSVWCQEPTKLNLNQLDNSDIDWTEHAFGVSPDMSRRASARLRDVRAADIPELIDMTEDPKRFIVAHVMLAEVFRTDNKIYPDKFFGITIDQKETGEWIYPNYKPKQLRQFWEKIARDHKDRIAEFEKEKKEFLESKSEKQ